MEETEDTSARGEKVVTEMTLYIPSVKDSPRAAKLETAGRKNLKMNEQI